MTSITSVSRSELNQRRQQLRRQRRLRVLQGGWRTLFVSGMAGGLFWVTTLPGWVIRQPEQIAIEGNHLLSTETVRSLVAVSYPQSLFRLKPQVITESLEAKAPISQATVIRQLFPPRLTVQVQERHPVAVASSTSGNAATNAKLIDENGFWIPLESYTSLDKSFKLPPLKVVDLGEQYRAHWPQIYQEISRSPIKIFEVNWQDPGNLVLRTELGMVHLGPYSSRFTEQLKALDRMRQLPNQLNASQIMYINLRNPEAPSLQMQKDNSLVKSNTL